MAVRNKDGQKELQRPWEDASQERTARLYASGSIAVFDADRGAMIRKELSLATVLAEIMSGERVLVHAVVLTKSNGHRARKRVWALRDDLAHAAAAREEQRGAMSKALVTEQRSGPPIDRQVRPGDNSTAEQDNAPLPVDVQASEPSVELAPSPSAAETSNDSYPAPKEAAHEALAVNSANLTARPPKNRQPTPRGSWWKSIADWFRRL